MDFSSVTISFFIHSTEDEERLIRLVESRLGVEDSEISTEKITGHFGNETISVGAHIIGSHTQKVAHRIVGSLSSTAKESIRAQIARSLDEHDSLFLRLDRQSFGDASLSLSDEEPIKIKLKPKVRSGRESMIKQYEEMIR